MELIEAVRGRRSAIRLTDPGPSDDEVCELLTDAATGPDHGLLRPWRLVLVRGAARRRLARLSPPIYRKTTNQAGPAP